MRSSKRARACSGAKATAKAISITAATATCRPAVAKDRAVVDVQWTPAAAPFFAPVLPEVVPPDAVLSELAVWVDLPVPKGRKDVLAWYVA
jgi:hypothetical protein